MVGQGTDVMVRKFFDLDSVRQLDDRDLTATLTQDTETLVKAGLIVVLALAGVCCWLTVRVVWGVSAAIAATAAALISK